MRRPETRADTVDEFELIARYFTGRGARREDVALGVGDDAAVLEPAPGHSLVLTTDTLVAGRHFPEHGFPARALGHRSLAVNLSDMAAMGAEPAWALLALTLPGVDERWLEDFAAGVSRLAERTGVALAGGNLAGGPLAVTVTLAGQVRHGRALRRSGARAGDTLWTTGSLGGGAAGLRALRDGAAIEAPEVAAYAWPEPRVLAGRELAPLATAAIDISDGLVGDLSKLLAASGGLGAELSTADIPLAPGASIADALGPSDDYELLLTVPQSAVSDLEADRFDGGLHRIGRVTSEPGFSLDGRPLDGADHGYSHFP